MSSPGDGYSQQQWNAPTQAGPPPAAPKPRNGMGTAALIVGILAILSCWIPVLGLIGLVLGIVAIILGAIGRGRAKRMEANNGGVAMAGLVLGVLSVLVSIVVSVLIFVLGFSFLQAGGGQSLQQLQQCITQAQNAGGPAGVQQAIQQCQAQFEQQLPQLPGGGG